MILTKLPLPFYLISFQDLKPHLDSPVLDSFISPFLYKVKLFDFFEDVPKVVISQLETCTL